MMTKYLYVDIRVNKNTVVVFDLDDTLYNEIEFLRSAYMEMAQSLEADNWKSLFSNMFALYREGKDVFDYLAQEYGKEKSHLLEAYRNHEPRIVLFEGAENVLSDIKAAGGKIGVLTDGRSSTQRKKLSSLGLNGYVDIIVISEEIGSTKPNEQNYSRVEEEFPHFQYYYIADNLKKDFITPNRRGWGTIGLIDNGLNIHTTAQINLDTKYLPQHFILELSELRVIQA